MTETVGISMEALSGLLEERRRYETWIAQLEAKRGATPPHVFERVHGDYMQRLNGVTEQMRARAADLEGAVAELEQRVNALLSEENARRDERAEVELRASVGEYAPEHAHERLAQCDEAIKRLSAERGQLAAELTRMQEILGMARRPTGDGARPAAAAPQAVPAAAAAPAPASPPPAAPAPPPQPTTGGFDELAFLNSVVRPRDQRQASGADPLGAAMARPVGDGPAPSEAPSTRTASATPPGNTPAFLKSVPSEQMKTLKCQECGTMNYPTEWYCERCGGELAAM